MDRTADILTVVFGALVVAYTAFEIYRRIRRLRDLYQVLGREEYPLVARLEDMAAEGLLQPYVAAS